MDYESTLESVYGNGLFHIILNFFFSLSCLVFAFEIQSMVFLHLVPAFNCSSFMMSNFSQVTWIDKETFLRLNSSDFSSVKNMSSKVEQCWAAVQTHSSSNIEAFACDQWTYASEPMYRTLVTDYDLICDRKYLITWLETCIILAIAAGHSLSIFSDFISRRKLLIFYVVWECITTLSVPFAPTLLTMFLIRIIRMLSCSIYYLSPCIIEELVPFNKRAIYGNLFWLPFGLGYLTCSGIAYLTRNWFIFRLVGMINLVIFIPIVLMVPESPRWLIVNGKCDEFIVVIQRIARWNKVNLPENFNEQITASFKNANEQTNEQQLKCVPERDSVMNLMHLPNMRTKAIVYCISNTTIVLCYLGLITSPTFLSDNVFLSVIFQGLCEIPSSVIGWALSVFCGRRNSLAALQMITAAAVVTSQAIRPFHSVASSVVASVGRLGVTSAFCIACLYVTEIYPTTMRNFGTYLTLTVSGIGSAGAPIVNSLDRVFPLLPSILYASFCLLGAVLLLIYLPETKHCPLAQNLQQAELLRRGNEKEWKLRMTSGVGETILLEDLVAHAP